MGSGLVSSPKDGRTTCARQGCKNLPSGTSLYCSIDCLEESKDETLRFTIGTRVLCWTPVGWVAGHIIQCNYTEPDWPPDQIFAYQVRLQMPPAGVSEIIYVPQDNDELCRKLVPPWWEDVFNDKPSTYFACSNVFPDILRKACANENVNVQDVPQGRTALMHAVERNWHSGMTELIDMKADVNIASKNMKRALHFATPHGEATMKILIEAKANLDCQDKDPDYDPNFTSVTFGDRTEHRTPLHYVCLAGDTAAATLLLEANAKIDPQDAQFKTPLHLAIEEDDDGIVDLLLQYRADVHLGNQEVGMMNPPLLCVAKDGNAALVEKLIKAKADVNQQGKQELAALHLAARSGHAVVARALLSADADPMQSSQFGNAFALAHKYGGIQLLEAFGEQRDTFVTDKTIKSVKTMSAELRAALFLD